MNYTKLKSTETIIGDNCAGERTIQLLQGVTAIYSLNHDPYSDTSFIELSEIRTPFDIHVRDSYIHFVKEQIIGSGIIDNPDYINTNDTIITKYT